MLKRKYFLVALFVVLSMLLAQCAAPAAEAPAAEEPAAPSASDYKMAAIFPGVITDADYNTLAYVGLTAVQTNLGVEIAYSESVAVPDVDRVMREYLDAGFNIIWTHGSQFVTQTAELAPQFPEAVFIAEGDGPVENAAENLWVIDRNFQVGYYGIGALAALQTETGKIGYLGGLSLPFSYAEVHAIQQALADMGSDVELTYVWAGDFNDPTKARQVAEAMIAEDVDVIMGSLNLGMFGVFEAAKASDKHVLVTAKYTDKTSFAPDNYLTSLLYDFTKPMNDIVSAIMAGERGGYYPLGFDTGVSLQFPLLNAKEGVEAQIEEITNKVISGEIKVVKDNSEIK